MAGSYGFCRSCGKQILWIKTASGKSMPCDPIVRPYWAKEKAAGKIVTPNGVVLSCELNGDPQTATGYGYISHFATCPGANKLRRKK